LKGYEERDIVEMPRGAKLIITADNNPAQDALHEFLKL